MPAHRPTHYERLKVQPDAPTIVIRAAYRALAFRHHPDRRGPNVLPEDHEEMARLNAAYRVLMDPAQRLAYDAELASLAIPAFEPFRVPQYAASSAQQEYSLARHERQQDPGPQTRVDLDWAEVEPAPARRVAPREWALLGALAVVTLIGGSWLLHQANLRADTERVLAERVRTSTPSGLAESLQADTVPEAPPPAAARKATAPPAHPAAATATHDVPTADAADEAPPPSLAPGALTFVLPQKAASHADDAGEEAAASEPSAGEAAVAADEEAPAKSRAAKRAPATVAQAASSAATQATDEADPALLLERKPSAAGRPARATSAAASGPSRTASAAAAASSPQQAGSLQPIVFHLLDGRPLDLKSAGGLPEVQPQQPVRRGPPGILR